MSDTVGLDISERAVQAVSLSGSGRRVRVTGCYTASIALGGSAERSDLIREAVEELFDEHKLSRDKVVVSLAARECFLRQIWLPFKKPDQIAKTLSFEVESQGLSRDISDLVLTYAKIRETANRSELLVAAAPHDVVEEYLSILHACGIDPIAIDLDLTALYNVLRRSSLAEEAGSMLLADLQADGVRMILVDQGGLRLARSCRVSPAFDEAGYYSAVAREIRLALDAKDLPLGEEGVAISGPVAAHPEAATHLGNALHLPVRVLDFAEEVGAQGPASVACAVALGAGYKGVGGDRLKMDFRVAEYIYKTGYQRIKNSLRAVSVLAMILFLLLGAYVRINLLPPATDHAEALSRAEQTLWDKTVLLDSEFRPGEIATALEAHQSALANGPGSKRFTPSLHLLTGLQSVDAALRRYAKEQKNQSLYVRDISYSWQDEGLILLRIRGSFGVPAGKTDWQRFKQLLNDEGPLKVVEGLETSETMRGQNIGFKVKLAYRASDSHSNGAEQ